MIVVGTHVPKTGIPPTTTTIIISVFLFMVLFFYGSASALTLEADS